jgi:hypothetical protein
VIGARWRASSDEESIKWEAGRGKALPRALTAQCPSCLFNAMNGSWNDFPETAEELNAQIEENRTLGRPIEML